MILGIQGRLLFPVLFWAQVPLKKLAFLVPRLLSGLGAPKDQVTSAGFLAALQFNRLLLELYSVPWQTP